MAAVSPIGSDGADWMIGVGSASGLLQARHGADGALVWERQLWMGSATTGGAGNDNALSSVIALDVDGDGRVEFVVGAADGWLYALDAATGSVRWSIEIGAPLGEPIAADFQNESASGILVPAADGFLYAIGPADKAISGSRLPVH
jgi:outer membrane protein assembly factor BamB